MISLTFIFCCWILFAIFFAVYDAVNYAAYDWSKVRDLKTNPHAIAILWRVLFAALLLHFYFMWFPYDFSLKYWARLMLGLGFVFSFIHTGIYLQVRRWIDPQIRKNKELMKVGLGKGYWFFGDTPYKGHWLVKWLPSFIKKILIVLFESPWWLRIIYLGIGYVLLM